jgi:hypothetical protein
MMMNADFSEEVKEHRRTRLSIMVCRVLAAVPDETAADIARVGEAFTVFNNPIES